MKQLFLISKNKRVLLTTFILVFLGGGAFFYDEPLINLYFRLTPWLQWLYDQDKALVLPYFDEAFYRREYDAELQKTGQTPIDHFMQRSTCLGGGDFDPNPWFSVTLYKEHLWPCSGNPFVDFLRQPLLKVQDDAKSVEIYAKIQSNSIARGWQRKALCVCRSLKSYLFFQSSLNISCPYVSSR